MANTTDNRLGHGFSVGTLLLLTAVVAIGLAAGRTLVIDADRVAVDAVGQSGTTCSPSDVASTLANRQQRQEDAAIRGAAGIMIGLLVGIGIGATRPRPVLGVSLGILVGGVVGGVAGGVLTQRENLLVAVIGSAVLLALGGGIQLLSSRKDAGD